MCLLKIRVPLFKLWRVLLGVIVYAFAAHALAAEQYAIFTLDSHFESLSVHKARKLYRGKTKQLQGRRIELSDWPAGSEERSEFYRYLLNKNLAQMNAHWASLSFSGKARPPTVIKIANIEALLIWMGEKPNRIGYAPLSSLPTNAQVLYVVSSEN
ncbi:hypothetical protein [Vibrio sp. CAU 1672]|uniref:hypothetical protein n=1 Tax=Vibrio sp. CAU 1672 TaxID=3032594 RepID=UPI0023DAD960|nr:hypothetical protein [Vibrio sp. CAU 1672]MDF2152231.1 hypothetical protein [Vibrio sp. CAU 1672]